ncbi:Predicted small secreted protein [Desulfacinum hydrothermale DSM 13146]|uniref:Predicted small secreted protein n=1 Tax=Desulfacinum hydrothermale DSM 13146 TaxID=1121390 RepID=A0A1W1XSD6_9BACT|nr:entericidin A/B family lipoprotein [Desulfacinum hydrothermale]SMC26762.1 Predicted small secreted protein [Desulfacinum hydrothermale DSM 13146]
MKRWLVWCVALMLAAGSLTACNTVKGIGKDLKSLGRAIERASGP